VLSVPADILGCILSLLDLGSTMAAHRSTPAAPDPSDVDARFVPLGSLADPPGAEGIRGLAWALADHWRRELPEGPAKDQALRLLAEATDQAVAAVR
jgi:hypothetical protein